MNQKSKTPCLILILILILLPANAAFALLVAADLGFQPTKCREFAEQQINYVLGEGGRSFVVGFGDNPPSHPHHRSR